MATYLLTFDGFWSHNKKLYPTICFTRITKSYHLFAFLFLVIKLKFYSSNMMDPQQIQRMLPCGHLVHSGPVL